MTIQAEELRAAVLNARAASLNAEIAGMVAENQHRIACGESIAYDQKAFSFAIEYNRMGENNIINLAVHGEL